MSRSPRLPDPNRRAGRLALSAALAAASLAAPGCGDAERLRKAETELAAAQDELRAAREQARKDADAAAARVEELSAKATAADLARADEAAQRAADAEKHEKVLGRVERHRDELAEWVEKDLLPVAEQASPELASLREATEEMRKEVARLRGLEWKHDVMRRRIRSAEAGEWMQRDMRRELPEAKARDLVAAGGELGLVAPDTDLYKAVGEFIEGGAAAFYKPETRTFYHIEGHEGRAAYPIVFHELVHALEDQHFDLDAFYRAIGEDSDRGLARRGLVEGSASLFQDRYQAEHPEDVAAMMRAQMTPEKVQRQQRMLGTVPAFLTASLGLYPYQNGKRWVDAMTGGDPAKVSALYADPPESTEQVLHPEKFRDPATRDYPRRIETPDLSALPAGWRRLEPDTLGEVTVACLLAQLRFGRAAVMNLLDFSTQGLGVKEPAKTAVEGWDGDRLAGAVDPDSGRATLCWVSVWDSEKDAQEFADLYAVLLGGKVLGERPEAPPSPVRYVEAGTGRVARVVREGTRVVAVLGAAPDQEEALLAAGLAAKAEADPRDAADSAAGSSGSR